MSTRRPQLPKSRIAEPRVREKRYRHLNLDQLESFVTLADTGGMTAAARRLNLAQPTVSQHLQRLEEHLDRQLVERTPEGARLTSEGLRLLPLARGLLRLGQQFVEQDASGPLKLGACTNIGVYLLPQRLIDFRRGGGALPEVSIASNPEIRRRLVLGDLDLALLEWWDEPPGFEFRIWRQEPMVAIFPSDHELAARESVSLAELRSVPLIGGEPGTGTGRLLRDQSSRGPPLETAMNLGSTEAVKRAVAAGLGISLVLQSSVQEYMAAGKPSGASSSPVAVIPVTPALKKPLYVAWRMGLPRNHALLDYLCVTSRHRT